MIGVVCHTISLDLLFEVLLFILGLCNVDVQLRFLQLFLMFEFILSVLCLSSLSYFSSAFGIVGDSFNGKWRLDKGLVPWQIFGLRIDYLVKTCFAFRNRHHEILGYIIRHGK